MPPKTLKRFAPVSAPAFGSPLAPLKLSAPNEQVCQWILEGIDRLVLWLGPYCNAYHLSRVLYIGDVGGIDQLVLLVRALFQ